MDRNVLCQVLLATHSGDKVSEATEALKKMEQVPGFGFSLAGILCDASLPHDLRQSSGVILRRFITDHWEGSADSSSQAGLSENEKQQIRKALPSCLGDSYAKIRTIVASSIAAIGAVDFPESWPSLLEDLISTLKNNSKNLPLLQGCLKCLSEFAQEITDEQLVSTWPILAPVLMNFLDSSTATASTSADNISVIQSKSFDILSILFSSLQTIDVESFAKKVNNNSIKTMEQVHEKLVGPLLEKLLASARFMFERVCQQMSSPASLNTASFQTALAAARNVLSLFGHATKLCSSEQITSSLFASILNVLITSIPVWESRHIYNSSDFDDDGYSSDGSPEGFSAFLCVCLRLFSLLLPLPATGITLLKQNNNNTFKQILSILFAYLQYNKDEAENQQEDLLLYLQTEDDYAFSNSPRAVARQALNALIKHFVSSGQTNKASNKSSALLNLCISEATEFVNKATTKGTQGWRRVEVGLLIFGLLAPKLSDQNRFGGLNVDAFLKSILLPSLSPQANQQQQATFFTHPLLHARGCWCIARFALLLVKVKNLSLIEGTFKSLLDWMAKGAQAVATANNNENNYNNMLIVCLSANRALTLLISGFREEIQIALAKAKKNKKKKSLLADKQQEAKQLEQIVMNSVQAALPLLLTLLSKSQLFHAEEQEEKDAEHQRNPLEVTTKLLDSLVIYVDIIVDSYNQQQQQSQSSFVDMAVRIATVLIQHVFVSIRGSKMLLADLCAVLDALCSQCEDPNVLVQIVMKNMNVLLTHLNKCIVSYREGEAGVGWEWLAEGSFDFIRRFLLAADAHKERIQQQAQNKQQQQQLQDMLKALCVAVFPSACSLLVDSPASNNSNSNEDEVDREMLETGIELVADFLRLCPQTIKEGKTQPSSASSSHLFAANTPFLQVCCACVSSLLKPSHSDQYANNVGRCCLFLCCNYGDVLGSDSIASLLKCVVLRLFASEYALLNESLLIVFARFLLQHGFSVLLALKSMGSLTATRRVIDPQEAQASKGRYRTRQEYKQQKRILQQENINVLEFVLRRWFQAHHDFSSLYPKQVSLAALAKLVTMCLAAAKDTTNPQHQQLAQQILSLSVSGYPQLDAQQQDVSFSNMPLTSKFVCLLVESFHDRCIDKQARKAIQQERAAREEDEDEDGFFDDGEDEEEDAEDDEWGEDDEEDDAFIASVIQKEQLRAAKSQLKASSTQSASPFAAAADYLSDVEEDEKDEKAPSKGEKSSSQFIQLSDLLDENDDDYEEEEDDLMALQEEAYPESKHDPLAKTDVATFCLWSLKQVAEASSPSLFSQFAQQLNAKHQEILKQMMTQTDKLKK